MNSRRYRFSETVRRRCLKSTWMGIKDVSFSMLILVVTVSYIRDKMVTSRIASSSAQPLAPSTTPADTLPEDVKE